MKVLLLKEVKKIGHIGDVKEVSRGYACNFLIPQGLATMLTKHSLDIIAAQKKKKERTNKELRLAKKKTAAKLDQRKIVISAKSDDKGTLYAGLSKRLIAAELKTQGFDINPGEIRLKKQIKKIGSHKLELLIAGKRIKINLAVVKDR